MEFLLNLVWVCVSVALMIACLRCHPRSGSGSKWAAAVTLCLLVLLLLPAISMTDDLIAMRSPAEAEHTFASHRDIVLPAASLAAMYVVGCLSLSGSGLSTLNIISARVWPANFATVALTTRVRALGVRGPSASVTL